MVEQASWFRGLKFRLLTLSLIPVVAFVAILGVSGLGIKYRDSDVAIQACADMGQSLGRSARLLWEPDRGDASDRERIYDGLRLEIDRFEDAKAAYLKRFDSVEAASLFRGVEENRNRVQSAITEASSASVADAPSARHALETKLRTWWLVPGFDAVERATSLAEQASTANAGSGMSLERLNLLLFLGGSLLVLVLGLWLARSLSNVLASAIRKLSSTAQHLGLASTHLNSSSQQLSSGASEAAASLEETVASLGELSTMVRRNADNAKEASHLSQNSRSSAEQGESEIKQLIQAMSEIAGASKKIEEIINVIDDIAFQTNLLALNAAVEAARAGEQGKGFAVVADAVRSLAQRSASAAKDITELIKDTVGKVERGANIADRSGTALNTIVTSIKKVAELNNEIASASQEQSEGIAQISRVMNQLDQATQSNAASAEQTASTASEMNSQAGALQTVVTEIADVIYGGHSRGGSGPDYQNELADARGNVIPLRDAGRGGRRADANGSFGADDASPKLGNLNEF